jgi:feruloyl-CoA synthase
VITGHGREQVGALIFPNAGACRRLADAGPDSPLARVVVSPAVREAFETRLEAFNGDNPGSSTAIHRALLLNSAPSLEAMEVTDKGSLNQRAVLAHRADVVSRLYDAPAGGILL